MTLEQLENDYWGEAPENSSYLVNTCHKLRQVPVKELGVEDLRILIGQNIGLKYLMPIVIDVLKENPFCEGDLFEGDLLLSVLSSDREFWRSEKEHSIEMLNILKSVEGKIETLDSTDEIKSKLMDRLISFQTALQR